MNDYRKILNNLFDNKNDVIEFQNFEESNIIKLNNNNKGNFNENRLILILNQYQVKLLIIQMLIFYLK